MSHRQPQSSTNLFGFGPVDMVDVGDLDGIGADDQDVMPLLDNSVFAALDGLPMALDTTNAVSMSGVFNGIIPAPVTNPDSQQPGLLSLDTPQMPSGSADDAIAGATPLSAANSNSQNVVPGGSAVNEFTKRRNWSARVIEELKDLLHILDPNGRIKHVSQSITTLTGFAPEDVLEHFVRDFIHPDDNGLFTAELNEAMATGNPLRLFYRLKKKDGSYAVFESVGHAHIASARFAPNPSNQTPFCQAVFMMSRPYPTRNASLLDSFLEHKIENERLKRRIAELRKEEADDAEESQSLWRQSQEGRSDIAPSEDTLGASLTGATPFHHQSSDPSSMPPPERPLNFALTRENLEGQAAGNRPDSIRDKMARYESSHADTIEMLTGLRYQEGERSRGITTGNASPTLIKGDAGIAIPVDRDPRAGDKKKKIKLAEEYVCTDCGTLDSPEWRKGPGGPKTLCNACGLRWAKKEKKSRQSSGAAGGPTTVTPAES